VGLVDFVDFCAGFALVAASVKATFLMRAVVGDGSLLRQVVEMEWSQFLQPPFGCFGNTSTARRLQARAKRTHNAATYAFRDA
jgi:hypothetical protein